MEASEVYRLSALPRERVAAMRREIIAAGDVWTRQYAEY
jgi:hypothetical protein